MKWNCPIARLWIVWVVPSFLVWSIRTLIQFSPIYLHFNCFKKVFAGDRVHEFAMKLAGATYMDVQTAGGGIHFTTEKTRAAEKEKLLEDFLQVGFWWEKELE